MLPGGYNLAQEVHGPYNQSEVPRVSRWRKFVDALRRRGWDLNWPGGITPIPYHKDNLNYGGVFRPVYSYPISPLPLEHGYRGEAFLVMHPDYPLPHPSGLPDETLLSPERFAEARRGGV